MNSTTTTTRSFEIRRADSRGRFRNDWLDARFSFSFGSYRDPARDRFGPLLALNEDVVRPGSGFAMHPHTDLEIFIVPRTGTVEHRDSQGRHALVARGEVQMMRAGHGIRHSQMNPSADTPDHHFQIWLEPRRRGLEPRVEQRRFGEPLPGRWMLVVSPDGEARSLVVDQDARVHLGALQAGETLPIGGRPGRSQYLHVMSGEVSLDDGGADGARLQHGDALACVDAAPHLLLRGTGAAELLLFDLPAVARSAA